MKAKYEGIRRRFSESLKRDLVRKIDRGELRVSTVAREYDVSTRAVYKWLRTYSVHYRHKTRVVVEKQSMDSKLKALRAQVAELERKVGQKQLELEYLEKVIEIAERELGVDIKKKSAHRSSSGSGSDAPSTGGK